MSLPTQSRKLKKIKTKRAATEEGKGDEVVEPEEPARRKQKRQRK